LLSEAVRDIAERLCEERKLDLPHFNSYLTYYTGKNKNVARLIINRLTLKRTLF